jgi:hypothetical protein
MMNKTAIGNKAILTFPYKVNKEPTNKGPSIAPALPITLYKPKNSPAFSFGINFPK